MNVKIAIAISIFAVASAAHADWDPQFGARLTLGGGAYVSEARPDPWPLFELGLRADMLLGERRPDQVRFGPALDLRTEDFRTFEIAGALELFLPVGMGLGFTLVSGADFKARPEGRDGGLLLEQIAFGYRSFNYFSIYGWAVNVYAGTRIQLPEPRAWEITIGVEIDCELIFVIPFLFLYTLATQGGDPDEPTAARRPPRF